ncbi:MAG: proline--tRNA ligase [Bacteroidetes bacterium]|nr:proline--tRNA ligase [Bacteroidota bacterium]
MRLSKFFGETLREAPSESDSASSQMLARAGYVRQLAAGLYSYLPLAHRSLRKIEQILREEMDAIGGQELCMPVVHPAEIWQESGRWYDIGDEMGRFQDRKGRDLVLALTHEEVVATLCKSEIRSYRQLPQLVYHMQTKFRDELRARGGLIRVREFVMKDSYSLDKDMEGLQSQYVAHYDAYHRIGARLGLDLVAVKSDPGMMGGKTAHEFMYLTPVGEDSLAVCEETGYASNLDVAMFQKIPESSDSQEPLTRIHTPGQSTIAKVAKFCGVSKHQTGKMVFFMGDFGLEHPPRLIAACVRGDMEINELQLRYAVKAQALRPAEADEITAIGCVPGYASFCDIDPSKALLVADDLIPQSANLVVGANEKDWHYTGTNYGRDFTADIIAPIALAYDGAPDPIDGKPLRIVRGIEVGNIFQLGTRYSDTMGATYTDETGEELPIFMGSYGIGVGRALACVAEEHSDDYGLDLPISVAPYHVILVSLGRSGDVHDAAENLYFELLNSGVEVLYDDRPVSPGVKFADADLRGIPLRCTVSSRSLGRGGVEFGRRRSKDLDIIPLDDAVKGIQEGITQCFRKLQQRLEHLPTWASRSKDSQS